MEVAVIKTGGKQYVVAKGDTIVIEKLPKTAKASPSGSVALEGGSADSQGEYRPGDTVVFDQVLLVDNGSDTTIGAPTIKGAEVKGTVTFAGKAKKVDVVKYKAKSRYYKRRSHRQPLLKVKIDSIN